MPECLLPGDRICQADRTKKPSGASERFRNALSSARIHSGLVIYIYVCMYVCAKHLKESPKEHMIYSLHEVGSQCVLEMGEATIRASTYKKKLGLRGHSLKMVRAYLHPVL